MRLVVDALAADFGGIRTYVENLLAAWDEPGDELLVMVHEGSDLATGHHARCEVRIPRPGPVGRPLRQSVVTKRLVADFGADAVLATMPSTSLVRVGVPLAVVVHDLRHELRPEQFSRSRRLLRKVAYGRAYDLADVIIAVSQRSLDDLQRLHPHLRTTPSTVVHHGADHVLSWPEAVPSPAPRSGPAITFAHHTNKNPHLVLDAWAHGVSQGLDLPSLQVLGTGDQRNALNSRVSELGLTGLVTLAPYLPEAEFRQAMARASMIVFPSDFEGFGLPIVEGMLLGIPVVIGPEPASLEVAGGHAAVMSSFSAPGLAEAVARASRFDEERLTQAREHAARFTWRRSVAQTRAALAG
ncbi:glycosyltransferase family 4 protein [Nocardioides sp. JQ2195]|uniref:glycosyltransferase family 4 protein n=1 Tax=Nocardioides sp. JQ2195 TaxID=2592334 RepID=UPI00143ED7F6|nr:glycosyltransferase family 1 protein [Nocardioides sp. JQ2195]QIX25485.1 glycosyltransferase family 4 protein [Nocardioides sp. JQ2195]